MIGLFKAVTGSPDVRLVSTYNSLSLNAPGDDPDDTFELNRILPAASFDFVTDAHPDKDGSEAYAPRKTLRRILVEGMIRAPSIAKLFDKMETLAVAFDPVLVSDANLTVDGFIAYDFSTPTTDTATYATGLMPCRYYARAMKTPEPVIDYSTGFAAAFTLDLLLRDPRRYLQAESTLVGAGTANNTAAAYPSWPTVTVTMSGAGSATFAVGNSTDGKTLTLNLSGLVNTDVVTIDMQRRDIKVNGTTDMSLVVSGDYFRMKPGNNTITVANGTNATVSTAWRSAFPI